MKPVGTMKHGFDSKIVLSKRAILLVFVILPCYPCWAKMITNLTGFVEYTGLDHSLQDQFSMECPVGDSYLIRKRLSDNIALENACSTSDLNEHIKQTVLFLFIEHKLYGNKSWSSTLDQAVQQFTRCSLESEPGGNQSKDFTCNQISALPYLMGKQHSTVARESKARHTPAMSVVSYFFALSTTRNYVRVDDILHIDDGSQIISTLRLQVIEENILTLDVHALSYLTAHQENQPQERRMFVFEKIAAIAVDASLELEANVDFDIWPQNELFWKPSGAKDMVTMSLSKMYFTCHQDGIQLKPDDLRERFKVRQRYNQRHSTTEKRLPLFALSLIIQHLKKDPLKTCGNYYNCTFRLYFRAMGQREDLHILQIETPQIEIVALEAEDTFLIRLVSMIKEITILKQLMGSNTIELNQLNKAITKTAEFFSECIALLRNTLLSQIQVLMGNLAWWDTIVYSMIASVGVNLCLVLRWTVIRVKRKLEERTRRKDVETLHALLDPSVRQKDPKYDVFISYSSEDKAWVEDQLLQYLQTIGLKVCWDQDFTHFPPGKPLIQSIAEAIYLSRKTVAVFSPEYNNSRWTKEEFIMAYTRILEKDGPTDGLVVIKYRPCEVPPALKLRKYHDWTDAGIHNTWREFLCKRLPQRWTRYLGWELAEDKKKRFWDALGKDLGK